MLKLSARARALAERRSEGILVRSQTDKKQFALIFVIAFFIYMASQMIGTTIATYADSMGAGAQMIGMITGAFGIMALVPRPVSGQIVDNENNKLLLFAVLGFCVVSSAILIFASAPVFLMISRGVYGLGWGVGSTLCLTSACSTLSEEDMLHGIAIYTLGQTLAMVLGPSAALLILVHSSYRMLYTICTLVMIAAFIMVFAFQTDRTGIRSARYSFNVRDMFSLEVYAPALMSMGGSLVYSGTVAFVLLYAADRGVENIHWFFTVQAATILVLRPVITRYVKEKDLVPATILSNVVYIVYLVVITLASKRLHFAAAAVLMGTAMAGAQPSLFNLCVRAVGPERRGRATNTNYASTDVGAFLGPYLAGLFSSWLGYKFIFLLMIVPLLIVLFVFCRYYYRSKEL